MAAPMYSSPLLASRHTVFHNRRSTRLRRRRRARGLTDIFIYSRTDFRRHYRRVLRWGHLMRSAGLAWCAGGIEDGFFAARLHGAI